MVVVTNDTCVNMKQWALLRVFGLNYTNTVPKKSLFYALDKFLGQLENNLAH